MTAAARPLNPSANRNAGINGLANLLKIQMTGEGGLVHAGRQHGVQSVQHFVEILLLITGFVVPITAIPTNDFARDLALCEWRVREEVAGYCRRNSRPAPVECRLGRMDREIISHVFTYPFRR